MGSTNPLAFLEDLSTSDVVAAAVRMGIPVSDDLIEWMENAAPAKLLKARMLADQANSPGQDEQTPADLAQPSGSEGE